MNTETIKPINDVEWKPVVILPRCEGCPFINNCHNECYEDVFDPVTGEKL